MICPNCNIRMSDFGDHYNCPKCLYTEEESNILDTCEECGVVETYVKEFEKPGICPNCDGMIK